MKELFLLSCAFALAAAPAVAQSGPSIYVHGGSSLAVRPDGVGEFWGLGFNGGAGLIVPLSQSVDLTVSAAYNRLNLDEDRFVLLLEGAPGLDVTDIDGGAYSIFSLTAGMRYTIASLGRMELYLLGSTGGYYWAIGDMEFSGRIDDEEVEGTGVVEGEEFSLGVALGAGLSIGLASRVRLFVEPRYVVVLKDPQYFPVRVGLSFEGLFD